MKKLPREFYSRPTLDVAKDLLGKYLVYRGEEGKKTVCKIVEVEGYIGAIDKAAHSYNNRITKRTKVMFGAAGYAYVYLIYGMYHCLNVVTQKEGEGSAVLIRAAEPVEGLEIMAQNRYNKPYNELIKREIKNITNGPGKLCKAMGITIKDNGIDLLGMKMYITEGEKRERFEVVTTKRINIDYAEEAVHFPWRYYIKDNAYVSRK